MPARSGIWVTATGTGSRSASARTDGAWRAATSSSATPPGARRSGSCATSRLRASSPSAPPSSASRGSNARLPRAAETSAEVTYGRFAVTRSARSDCSALVAPSSPSRSLTWTVTSCATPCAAKFSEASSSASGDRSEASSRMRPSASGARKRSASASATAPPPVATSHTATTRSSRTRRAATSAIADSASSSVSGRGIRARRSVVTRRPNHSLKPRMYATGSPPARRSIQPSSSRAVSSSRLASGCACSQVRSLANAWLTSSSASRRAVSEPASVSRVAVLAMSAPALRSAILVRSGPLAIGPISAAT